MFSEPTGFIFFAGLTWYYFKIAFPHPFYQESF